MMEGGDAVGADASQDVGGVNPAGLIHDLLQALAWIRGQAVSAGEALPRLGGAVASDATVELASAIACIKEEAECQVFEIANLLQAFSSPSEMTPARRKLVRQSPVALFRQMLPPYEKKAAERGVSMVEVETPTSREFPEYVVEPWAIRRVFHNVIMNAVKYSFRGTAEAPRSIRWWVGRHDAIGRSWAINLENYGVGPDADELPLLFRRGYRGRNARAEGISGAGLGLASAAELMQANGGFIRLRTKRVTDDACVTTTSVVFCDGRAGRSGGDDGSSVMG